MFCEKCGAKIEDGIAFCPNCGSRVEQESNQTQSVQVQETDAEPKKKIPVKAAAAVIVLVIVIIIPLLIFTSKSSKIVRAYNANDPDHALDIYYDNFDTGDTNIILTSGIKSAANKTVKKCRNGEISEDEAYDILFTMGNMSIKKLEDVLENAEKEMSYVSTLNRAQEYMDEENYADAITAYGNIPEDSEYYSEAAEGIETAKEAFSANAEAKMEEYLSNIDYANPGVFANNARSLVNQAKNSGSDDLAQSLMDKVVEGIQSNVNKLLEDNDYTKAKLLAKTAANYFSDESKITDIHDSIQSSYEEIVLKKAEEEFKNQNYEKAASTVQAAMAQVDESTALESKYDEYKSYLPSYINDLDYFNKDGYIRDNYSKLRDNTGKSYQRIYCIDGSNGYAEYLINGNYTNFEGVAGVAYDRRDTDDSQFFEVYGDGVLIYTSPTFKSGVMPVDFNIDITGVKILKIMYPKVDNAEDVASIFDGKVYNKNNTKQSSTEDSTSEETTADAK